MSQGKGQQHAADQSAANATGLSNQYNNQQQQAFGLLFGNNPGTTPVASGGSSATGGSAGASGSGSGGAITQFLNPSSLNVTTPTGVYQTQMDNANDAAASQFGQNAQNIKSNATQAGFGANTPAGFTQQQENQNAQGLASAEGTNFQTAVDNQYNQALQNFWNSVGAAQTAAGQGQQGATANNNTAASTYSNLYGTAAKAPASPIATGLAGAAGAAIGAL